MAGKMLHLSEGLIPNSLEARTLEAPNYLPGDARFLDDDPTRIFQIRPILTAEMLPGRPYTAADRMDRSPLEREGLVEGIRTPTLPLAEEHPRQHQSGVEETRQIQPGSGRPDQHHCAHGWSVKGMNVQAPNPFLRFWSLGYRRLVPIVPPGANISPKSALAKRPGSIGKAVGVQRRDGSWSGMDWIPYTASENDLRDWHAMGAGVGLKTGAGIVALDIDTLHQTVGDLVQALAAQMLGPAPLRWGREPKRLMLYRAPPETPYMRVIFDDGLPTKVGKEPRVELLTDQRQCVVHGVHPDTGRPYRWEGLCPLEELTTVTAEQLRAFFARLAAELPAARVAVDEAATDRQHVNQEALRGRSDLVAEAVRRLPNTVDLFPTYDDYIRVGAAIKGALPDDPGLAEECFVEWAGRFEGDDDFDPARAAADLRRVKPPFALGASWLYDQAERHGGAPSFVAGTWFDAAAAPSPAEGEGLLFGISPSPGSCTQSLSAPIAWIDPTTWEGRPVVQREWEVENLIPRREVTLLYGDGGIGKTLAAHQYATCAAAGVPWFGQNTRKARVMCFFCEDDADELHRRQIDINRSLGIGFGDLADLRVVSRKHQDNFLMTWSRHGGEPRLSEVWRQLLADAQRFGVDVIILDTIADIFGGSEIDRVQVNYFVKTCLGGLAQGIGGSVMALGHPSQSGKTEGTSGSTAWNNAARSRLFLRYPKGVDRGDIRELEAKKLNYGPRGSLLKLRWKRGAFEVIGARMPAGAAQSVDVPKIEDTAEAAVAAAIMASPDERMSLARNSKYYAATVLRRRHPDLLETLSHSEVQEAVERLRQSGQLQETMIGREENSRPIKGLRILETLKVGHNRERSSIFA